MNHQISVSEYLRTDNSKNWVNVDLFAGGGGASEGIKSFIGRDPDIAINHDRVAIAMHKTNHPGSTHYRENVWQVSPRHATKGRPVGVLWASPDCTHFSKAKGGQPKRDIMIRSLAWVVKKWMREVRPRLVIIENVEEFKTWGPLDSEGVVVQSQKGTTFSAFIRRIKRLGYRVEWKELRACDYGAPTIRKRFFLIARCDGLPITWPEPTHGKGLIAYRTAADIIDWSIPCPSIFDRKKPLVENTLRRIAKGIERYVINAADPFIVTYYGPKKGEKFRGQSIREPLRTQTTENRFGLVTPYIIPIQHYNGSDTVQSINEPMRTITASPKGGGFAVAIPHIQRQFGQGIGSPIEEPIGTVTAGGMGKSALVTAFMAQHNGGKCPGSRPIDSALSTITTSGSQQQVVTSHLLKMRGSCKDGQKIDQPAPTITAGGNHIGEVRAFLLKYYGQSVTGGINDPLNTVTTKDRYGLVTVNIEGEPYVIVDIGMRMLSPRELFLAQGFDEEYKIDIMHEAVIRGKSVIKKITKTDQVRLCGNSVCPPMSKALVEANAGFLHEKISVQAG